MDLKTLCRILSRRKWILGLSVVAGVGLAGLAVALSVTTATSTATLHVATATSGSVSFVDYELNYADRLMNTFAEIATTRSVLNEVARQEGLEDLSQVEVSVDSLAETELLKVSVRTSDPQLAARIANRVAEELIARSQEVSAGNTDPTVELLQTQVQLSESVLSDAREEHDELVAASPADSPALLDSQSHLDQRRESYLTILEQYNQAQSRQALETVTLTIIDPASVPTTASAPRVAVIGALGIVLGLSVGIGIMALAEKLDSTLRDRNEIRWLTDAPIVGMIPESQRSRFVHEPRRPEDFLRPGYPHDDEFDRIRIALLAGPKPSQVGVIAVTSSDSGEGKTTVVMKLAQSFASVGLAVVVVDANCSSDSLEVLPLPRPNHRGQQNASTAPGEVGLLGMLEDGSGAQLGIRQTKIPGVRFVSSGEATAHPADLLCSTDMEQLLKELKTTYDVILVDTPGLLEASDAVALAPLVDGVLFVFRVDYTKRDRALAGLRQLAIEKANLVGVVLNGAKLHAAQAAELSAGGEEGRLARS